MNMKDIKMVDLKGQYDRLSGEINTAIQGVIDSSAFINGPDVQLFCDELADFLDVRHVVPCGSGTDALLVALMALDLKPGDEVITSPFSFVSCIEVIRLLGLTPVLADVDPLTFNIDPLQVEKRITSKTKAIIPVHLFGQCANMGLLLEHDIPIIEDTAQSLGTDYLSGNGIYKAGTIGAMGTCSFFPSKNLGCYGDGGAIITDDTSLYNKLKPIVNHGSSRKYYYDRVGINSRLDTIQAAILRVKLRHLSSFNKARQDAADTYDIILDNKSQIQIPYRASYSTHIFHQYTLIAEGRDRLVKYLRSKHIPVMVYYPLALHLQKAYQDLGYDENDFPVAEYLSRNVLSIPMHTELEVDQIEYICHHIKEGVK